MSYQDLHNRDILELVDICQDLFIKYADADSATSSPYKRAAQQLQRFRTINWQLFTRDRTLLDRDKVKILVIKQLAILRINLEFAAFHDEEVPDTRQVINSDNDIERKQFVRNLDGTPSEAIDAAESIIDRLCLLRDRQVPDAEVPTDAAGTTYMSVSGGGDRQETQDLDTKTTDSMRLFEREKSDNGKQASICSEVSTTPQEIPLDDKDIVNDRELGSFSLLFPAMASHQDQVKIVQSVLDIAKAHFHRREYQEAETEYRNIPKRYSELLNYDKSIMIKVKGNLANALAKQQDMKQEAEAEVLYHEVWTLCAELYDESHPYTLACRSNLAGLLEKRGEYKEAVEIYRQVLTLRKMAGHCHMDVISSSNKLANALVRLREFHEATNLYRKTLEKSVQELGERHPSTIITLGNLVNSLQSQGRYNEAKNMYLTRLKVGLEALESDHPCRGWIEGLCEVVDNDGK